MYAQCDFSAASREFCGEGSCKVRAYAVRFCAWRLCVMEVHHHSHSTMQKRYSSMHLNCLCSRKTCMLAISLTLCSASWEFRAVNSG